MADDQKALKKRLKTVMSLPYNQICSDCNERQPRWASLIVPPPGLSSVENYQGSAVAIGALCCLECSGSHRRLGVHISFVRSINLDSWKEKEVLAMEHGGNAKVNAIFEARLPQNSNIKPTNHADGPTRERFIRDKYERRKYYDPSGEMNHAPSSHSNGAANMSTSEDVSSSSVGPPSDAAKQRLEQRRARINKASSTVSPSSNSNSNSSTAVPTSMSTKSRTKVARAPASAPPPQSTTVDLLGFDTPPVKVVESSSVPTTTSNARTDVDLFDFSSTINTTGNGTNANNNNNIDDQWNQLTSQASQPQQTSKPSIDLASLYNGVQQQHPQQQPMGGFANFTSGNNNVYAMNNNANPMMMNMNGGGGGGMMNNNNNNNNNNMHQMNIAMQNMNFNNTNNGNHPQMTPQQMAYQQQMMMMQQQQQQQMMMHQQQQMMMSQQQQQQFSNTTMNHFGSQNHNATPTKSSNIPAATPEKDDPFAQFGTNMFR